MFELCGVARVVLAIIIFHLRFALIFISIIRCVINNSIMHRCLWVLGLYIDIVTEVLKNSGVYL